MNKIIYTFFLTIVFLLNLRASDNVIYEYKITFKQNPASKFEELREYIVKLMHTENILISNEGKSVDVKTIYPVNTNVLIGKFEKLNFTVTDIHLQNKLPISKGERDKIDEFQKMKEAEIIKFGK